MSSHGEWVSFVRTLHRPLPTTFRLSTASHDAATVAEALADGAALLRGAGALPAAEELRWCSSYQVALSKEALKAAPFGELAQMQRWLAKYAALGVLTRQAIESMVPVALLKVEPHHRVLDLCASPGSKTTQALEALHAHGESAPSGIVVANDVSPLRGQMLSRRCAALGEMCSRLLVTCHAAQKMPPLPLGDPREAGGRYLDGCFDRIICDVPCSGDGTARKNPSVWHRWTLEFALEMHPLQLQIALRGAALLAPGGLLCYSTCSLNPLENEAVVAELLTRCGGALEIVDSSAALPELRRADGLHTWTVMDDDLTKWSTHADLAASSDVPANVRRRWLPSMWPPPPATAAALKLERCLRLLPHLADMGGFFVVLLRKVAPLPGPPARALKVAELEEKVAGCRPT